MRKPLLLLLLMVLALSLQAHPLPGPQPADKALIVELEEGVEAELLKGYGGVGGAVGSVATLRLWPWVGVEELARSELVERVWSPRSFRLLLDRSVPEVRAPEVWEGFVDRYGSPVDGRGVAIAIIDTGIDYRHPDFGFPNGSTRILAIWDQTIEGRPPRGFDYGHECLRSEIEEGACPEVDEFGHGTYVASIAAGGGRAGPYRGVAPGAYLIVVKTGRPACGGLEWFVEEDELIDALHYVAGKARELGLRLVVNLSLGSDVGGHDGHTPIERALEALAEEGVVVVAAAGNSADDRIHAMGRLLEGEEFFLNWSIPLQTTQFELSLLTGPEDEVDIELLTPYGPLDGPVSAGPIVAELDVNAYEVGRELLLKVSLRKGAGERALRTGPWALRVKALEVGGGGVWHAWISSDTCSLYSREHFLSSGSYNITSSYTVSIPATSPSVIAVGAYVTKSSWRSFGGKVGETGLRLGELLYFSGRGPTRDGRVKPDLTAPGSIVVAAKPVGPPASNLDVSDYYTVKQGTSASAPHVAGAAALILQLFPDAGPKEVYAALVSSARWAEEMGARRPSNDWGWGKLDARAFYKVSLRVEGLPESFKVSVEVDGEELSLPSGGRLQKTLLRGAEHTVAAQPTIPLGEGSRYRLEGPWRVEVGGPLNLTLRYRLEHLLTVRSALGGEVGGGWYPNGSVARFSARELLAPEGLEILFKPSMRLAGWVDELGNPLPELRILMDRPHVVVAVYELDYGLMVFGWCVVAAATASTLTVAGRVYTARLRGRRRGDDGAEVQR